MIYRGESTEARPPAPSSRRAGRAAAWQSVAAWPSVALALALLAGCSTVSDTVSDIFGEDEPAPESTVATPPEAQGEQPFPNLATVPDAPPETMSAEERATIAEGLAADRANAEYTDEALGRQATAAPAPAPAGAPPAPAPAVPAAPSVQAPAAAQPAPAASAPPPAASPAPPPGAPAPAAPPVQAQPLPAPAAPAPAPATPAPAGTAQGAAPAASFPPTGGQQVLERGSVIVNPDAVLGSGAPTGSRLLPSGESRPAALIFFTYGSAGLSRSDVQVLRDVARLHQERGGIVRVIGHASQGGGGGDQVRQRLANLNISLARANAVARELARLGVRTDQIQVAAAGAQQPLYYESSPTGEAGNRRVEIYLDY